MKAFFTLICLLSVPAWAAKPAVINALNVQLDKNTALEAKKSSEDWIISGRLDSKKITAKTSELCIKEMLMDGEFSLKKPLNMKTVKSVPVWVWKAHVTSFETGNEEDIVALIFVRAGELRCLHKHNADGRSELSLLKAMH